MFSLNYLMHKIEIHGLNSRSISHAKSHLAAWAAVAVLVLLSILLGSSFALLPRCCQELWIAELEAG